MGTYKGFITHQLTFVTRTRVYCVNVLMLINVHFSFFFFFLNKINVLQGP